MAVAAPTRSPWEVTFKGSAQHDGWPAEWWRWTESKDVLPSLWPDEGTPSFLQQWGDVRCSILMFFRVTKTKIVLWGSFWKRVNTAQTYSYCVLCQLVCWLLVPVMLVMSCPSTTNEPESCSSEGSSCTTSSITTSDPSSMSGHTHATVPSLSDAPDTSQHEAPPPPPLPPPPPGAPPPPPPPATTSTSHNARKKRRVRSFFWKPIPEEKVRGKPNIWTLAVRQQQYQIDVRSVEELFGQQEEALTGMRGSTPVTGTSARISRTRSFKESSKDEVSGCHESVVTPTPATPWLTCVHSKECRNSDCK